MVFMTFLKLYGPVSRLMAWKPRVQEVIRRIRQGPYRRVRAGSTQHTEVSTLEGVGPGRPPPFRPLHLRQMGVHARVPRRGHEESDSQRPHRSEHSVDPFSPFSSPPFVMLAPLPSPCLSLHLSC